MIAASLEAALMPCKCTIFLLIMVPSHVHYLLAPHSEFALSKFFSNLFQAIAMFVFGREVSVT